MNVMPIKSQDRGKLLENTFVRSAFRQVPGAMINISILDGRSCPLLEVMALGRL